MFKTILSILLLSSLSLAVGPVLKTGQTKSYDADGNVVTDGSVKDDGYYQMGKTRSYTRSGTGVVRDNATGLEWQDNVDSVSKNWEEAKSYCSTLSLDSGGWRLPSIEELETLVDDGHYGPSVTSRVFQHISSDYYWSSTTNAGYSDRAWIVDFYRGLSYYYDKGDGNYVRCVRGGQLSNSNFSRDDNTGIVTDSSTGLQWQDNYSDNGGNIKSSNWIDAISYCENLTLGGYSDWRLPNKKELLSIADRSRYVPAIDSVFSQVSSHYYWSSTTRAYNSYYARVVDFYSGYSRNYSRKSNDSYVRCVRGGQSDDLIPPPPVITESGDPDKEYKFSVTLTEPLEAGQYIAINFDNQQGGWLEQSDPGGHFKLTQNDGNTWWENRTLHKPGLRSYRAGIFDADDTLVGAYSKFSTCTLDRCLLDVVRESDYGDPMLSGSGSQLMRGVDVANGNFHFASTDLTVPGKGPDFTLIRAYNSNADKWSFNLDANAIFVDPYGFNRQIAIGPREDGRMQYYYKDMDQKWYALSPGNFDRLVEEPDKSFTLYTKGNLYYRFADPLSASSGRLERIGDRDGNALSFSHSANRITGVTDAAGRSYTITRDGSGHITKAEDFSGRSVSYSWNGNGMLIDYENPRQQTASYEYSGTKLTKIKDFKGTTQYTIAYFNSGSNSGKVDSVTDAVSNAWSFVYNYDSRHMTAMLRPDTDGVNNNMLFVLDDNDSKVIERVDDKSAGEYRTRMVYKSTNDRKQIAEFGLVEQRQKPGGEITHIAYEANATGNPVTITDPLNRATSAVWDRVTGQENLTPLKSLKKPGIAQPTLYGDFTPSGKAQEVIDSLNGHSYFTYSAGLMTQAKDPKNNITKISYDAKGRPKTITDAKNNVVRIEYNQIGRVTKRTNARGYSTTYTYDANGNIKTVTDAKNGITRYYYDANDNLTSVKDPRGNTVTYTYDAFNRKTAESYSVGGTIYTRSYEYDALNRVHRVIDESGHATQTEFTVRSNVKKSTDPLNNSVTYTYDKNSNVKTITDAEGRTVTFNYDALDRKTKVTDPLGLYEAYTYNAMGLLASKRDKKGRMHYYEYDALGHMTKVIDPDGKFTRAAYDANGNLVSTIDRKGQPVTYTYDELNRLTELKDGMNRKWTFTYDANGNLLTRTTPENRVTTYTYDELDRTTHISYPDGQSVVYGYDANGNRITMTDAQGTTNYNYDELNRLTSVTDSFGNTVSYSYHPTGLLKELGYPGNKKVSYIYDDAGRLKSLTDWLGDKTQYSRDKTGLTTAVSYPNGVDINMTYDAAGRLTELLNKKDSTTISSHKLTLDNMGNPTSIQADLPLLPANLGKAAEMLYDSGNRLTSIDSKNILHDSDGRLKEDPTHPDPIQYAYNAQDLITSVTQNAITTDSYTYNGDGQRIARTSDGNVTRYILDTTGGDLYSVLAEADSNNTISHYYIYGEGLISQITGGSHRYYHYDPSGNTIALTDDSGTITDRYAYEPFGSTTTEGSSHNPFRFAGQYGVMDDGNGLHYMRARYYNTAMRRFMSLDALYGKVTDPMTLNRYQYVSGNPVVGVDPSGYCLEESDLKDCTSAVLSSIGEGTNKYISNLSKKVTNLTNKGAKYADIYGREAIKLGDDAIKLSKDGLNKIKIKLSINTQSLRSTTSSLKGFKSVAVIGQIIGAIPEAVQSYDNTKKHIKKSDTYVEKIPKVTAEVSVFAIRNSVKGISGMVRGVNWATRQVLEVEKYLGADTQGSIDLSYDISRSLDTFDNGADDLYSGKRFYNALGGE